MRGDSGFCRQRLLRWCERSGVHYIIGLARNARLEARVALAESMLRDEFERTQVKQRRVDEFTYAVDSWNLERRVLTRLEYGRSGHQCRASWSPTSRSAAAHLYDEGYCARGEAENRIKEAQLDWFGTRASCRKFAANQLRLLLGRHWPIP